MGDKMTHKHSLEKGVALVLEEYDDKITHLEWEYDGFNRIAARGIDDDFTIIAETYVPRLALSKTICGSYRRNAQLIAAAPRLLDACRLALSGDDLPPRVVKIIESAIACAAGDEHD